MHSRSGSRGPNSFMPYYQARRTEFQRNGRANGANDTVRRLGSRLVAVVSSDLGKAWWVPSVEQTLTRLPDPPPEGAIDAGSSPTQSGIPGGESNASFQPASSRSRSSGLRLRLFYLDAAAAAATWLVLGTAMMPATTATRRWGAALAATAVTLTAMQLLGLYRSRLCVQRRQELARIVVAAAVGAVAFLLLRGTADRRAGVTIVAAGSCVLALMTLRWIFCQWLCAQRARGRYCRGIVMIGTNDDAVDVWTMLHSQPELGYEVRGIIGKPRYRPDWANLPNGRSLDQLPDIARQTDATGVLVVANALSAPEVRHVIELSAANGLQVQICPGLRGLVTHRIRRLPMSGEAFLYVEPGRGPAWQSAAKRAINVLGAAVSLLIAAPILLMAWIAVRLEDGGPALYRQVRIGLNEQPFFLYKLRSMALDADKGDDPGLINERIDGPLFKAAHDPRVTRVGAVLRALSIDELPQLVNVISGAMSLVGPRPALPREVAQFDPELRRRHGVKPGITGLRQLEARDNPSFHAYRRLDILYVDNWSIGLDLVILLSTVPKVIASAIRIRPRAGDPNVAPSEATMNGHSDRASRTPSGDPSRAAAVASHGAAGPQEVLSPRERAIVPQ
jgi:exopolysaccharide biosynthesis polyprenyl glycosylphosphotransferase